jgi:hypothetical protein
MRETSYFNMVMIIISRGSYLDYSDFTVMYFTIIIKVMIHLLGLSYI